MATIGQALTAPESGWRRIDDTDSNIEYSGATWTARASMPNNYNSTDHYAGTGATVKFNFTGTKLRIIAVMSSSMSDNIEIKIDGKTEQYLGKSSSDVWQALNYEKTGLFDGEHDVEITNKSASSALLLGIDAIDIDSNRELKIYKKQTKRLAIKNPTENKIYSLVEKTIVVLPNNSDETITKYGIEVGEEIRLDEDFDNVHYPINTTDDIVQAIKKPLSIKFE